MPLLSAAEDFTRRTLSEIPGLLFRLAYITGLRDAKGNYRHWGLARIHGTAAAAEAMGRAHMELLTEVLRTPLSQLMREVEDSQHNAPGMLQVLLKQSAPLQLIVPAAAHAATHSHTKATILALRALADAKNRLQTSHRAA